MHRIVVIGLDLATVDDATIKKLLKMCTTTKGVSVLSEADVSNHVIGAPELKADPTLVELFGGKAKLKETPGGETFLDLTEENQLVHLSDLCHLNAADAWRVMRVVQIHRSFNTICTELHRRKWVFQDCTPDQLNLRTAANWSKHLIAAGGAISDHDARVLVRREVYGPQILLHLTDDELLSLHNIVTKANLSWVISDLKRSTAQPRRNRT